jgi:hypothetical protein
LTSKLTDEQLIELAKKELEEEFDGEKFDVGYYQEQFNIADGTFRVWTRHLYFHYENWSIHPVRFESFHSLLNLTRKSDRYLFVDRAKCSINLDKLLGTYVRRQKEAEKKKRAGQVPSPKPSSERKD